MTRNVRSYAPTYVFRGSQGESPTTHNSKDLPMTPKQRHLHEQRRNRLERQTLKQLSKDHWKCTKCGFRPTRTDSALFVCQTNAQPRKGHKYERCTTLCKRCSKKLYELSRHRFTENRPKNFRQSQSKTIHSKSTLTQRSASAAAPHLRHTKDSKRPRCGHTERAHGVLP